MDGSLIIKVGIPLFQAVTAYRKDLGDRASRDRQARLDNAFRERQAILQAKQANRALAAQVLLGGAQTLAPLVFQAWQERRRRLMADWAAEDKLQIERPAQVAIEPAPSTSRAEEWPPRSYPIDRLPGSLRKDLDLFGPAARRTPLVLLVPAQSAFTDERWGNGLLGRVHSELVSYQESGNLLVRRADRAFQWPDSVFHREDLGDRPTIALQLAADRERLDIHVAGCHLGPWPGCTPFPSRSAYTLSFPGLGDWDLPQVAEINSTTSPRPGKLPMPHDAETLADINHELAARIAAACAIAAVDSHHIMATPGYDELLDKAMQRAVVVADDWPEDYLLPLGLAADPAHHALHCCARLLRRGDTERARAQFKLALTLLAGHKPDADAHQAGLSSLAGFEDLVARAASSGLMHARHYRKLAAVLPEVDQTGSLGDRFAAEFKGRILPSPPTADGPAPRQLGYKPWLDPLDPG